uniref:Uncharacterized protein n=1 Tax=Chromera velia CCMP2878 TaxID=1169474 RepID=A0A0G4HT40_9ALVE|eukprot:Cvel_8385.t1-p1 / transcript=Cvel_8385.t1 / gene=Cvel_8385 / organism=Chromera_velia_CCMP2878 / gene_product=hypothetical protein / transcript_product=hypothetical protein / location=Cvel_scaffold462:47358-49524(+) / protein_length=346 / sequence_SO=supercontig / SO=protein_coding / is_pseudo=false
MIPMDSSLKAKILGLVEVQTKREKELRKAQRFKPWDTDPVLVEDNVKELEDVTKGTRGSCVDGAFSDHGRSFCTALKAKAELFAPTSKKDEESSERLDGQTHLALQKESLSPAACANRDSIGGGSLVPSVSRDDERTSTACLESRTSVGIDGRKGGRRGPLRPRDWVPVQCGDGTAVVPPQLLDAFAGTPLVFILYGTPEGLKGSGRLPCPCWVVDALGHFAVYKSLPRLPPPSPSLSAASKDCPSFVEREVELQRFADFFLLTDVVEAVEARRRQREDAKSEEGKRKRREELEKSKERLRRKFEANKSHLCPRDPGWEEIGRLRGVLPPLLSPPPSSSRRRERRG